MQYDLAKVLWEEGLNLVEGGYDKPSDKYPISDSKVKQIQNVLEIDVLDKEEGSRDPPTIPQEELDKREKYWADVNRIITEMCDQRRVNLMIANGLPQVSENCPKLKTSTLLQIIDAIKDTELKD